MDIPSVDYILDEAAKYNMAIWQVVLKEEQADSGETEEEIRSKLEKAYQVMKDAAMGGISSEMKSVSGLTGGDAAKYYRHYKNRKNMMGSLEAKAMSYSLGTSEYNAAMGIIVAAPTCGSSGILPGVMIAAQEEFGFTDREAINGLITAGGIGAVIATRATISGAAGGCQAEVGSAAAMAAAALTEVMGGTPKQCTHAAAIALKNCLGLACDPVAGLVEVPCVKRNAAGVAGAFVAAELALAGVPSAIPPDEVIAAMKKVGDAMAPALKETAEGGLAVTPTGCRLREELLGRGGWEPRP